MHQAYVREYHEEDNKVALFKASVVPGIFLLMIYLPISIICADLFSDLMFGFKSLNLILFFNASLISTFFTNFYSHIVRMEENGVAFSISQFLPKFLLVAFIGLLILTGAPNNFENLMLMNVGATVVSFFVLSFFTYNTWSQVFKAKINIKLVVKMLNFSIPLVVGGLAYWGLTTVDRMFLRKYSGFEELGVYSMASSLGGAVMVVSGIFSSIWHPLMYRWVRNGVEMRKLNFVTECVLVLISFIWSMFGLLSWVFEYFLPKAYLQVEFLVVSCAAGPLLYMLSETTNVGIGVTRKSIYSMLASFSAFIVCIILSYFFIPAYGASAAALISMLSFFAFFVVRTESGNRLWIPQPRVKLYFVVLTYICTTIVYSLISSDLPSWCFKVVWFILFIAVAILFKNSLRDFFKMLKNSRAV